MTKPNRRDVIERYNFLPPVSRIETYCRELEKYIKALEYKNTRLENKLSNFKLK